MPLVKALNAHPYRGRVYARDDVYEARDGDVELLKSLKRSEVVSDKDPEAQKYRTRDMRAGQAGIVGTRGTVPVSKQTSQTEMSDAVDEVEPGRAKARAKTASKPADSQ